MTTHTNKYKHNTTRSLRQTRTKKNTIVDGDGVLEKKSHF